MTAWNLCGFSFLFVSRSQETCTQNICIFKPFLTYIVEFVLSFYHSPGFRFYFKQNYLLYLKKLHYHETAFLIASKSLCFNCKKSTHCTQIQRNSPLYKKYSKYISINQPRVLHSSKYSHIYKFHNIIATVQSYEKW